MGKQIVASLDGLITRRSVVVWSVFVLHFALAVNHQQHPSTVASVAAARQLEPPETLWLHKLSKFLRFRSGNSGCVTNMDGGGIPTEEVLAIWEKQYSPSAWSVRFPTASEVISYHVNFVSNESEKNRELLANRLNVEYGSGDRDKVDIYGENLPDDAPLFVYIHGGYWQMLEKETSAYPAKPLVDRGIRVMIVGYELCPDVTLEELVRQIKVAGEFVLNYATENNVKHVSIAGHSAGAHLIASMLDEEFKNAVGEELKLLKDVYFISGVYNVEELRYTKSVNSNNLLGINDNNARRLSPLFASFDHLRSSDDNGLRFHVYVAQHDSDVFREMAAKMSTHLSSFGLNSNVKILPNLDHFDIVENLSSADYEITKVILEGLGMSLIK
ncbi:kynurenine formamidase [Anopheles nili]|uniref:kynurenine formamidase n=1 Tax=Anopheles nili TaxID=185578 RepID=UPI00237ADA6B|nr:kynurenine formamidase [Anopheles nili]